jgi:hypothetical protein
VALLSIEVLPQGRGLAHAAAKRELVATERPVDWMPPSIFRPPEVLTELEAVEEGSATPRFRDSRSKDLNALRTKSESSKLMDGAAKSCMASLA